MEEDGVCDPNGMKAELLQAEDAACQRKRPLLLCPPDTCLAQFGNDETPVSAEMVDASTHAPVLFLCPCQTSPINLHSLLLSPDAASESFWTQSSSKPLGEVRVGVQVSLHWRKAPGWTLTPSTGPSVLRLHPWVP